MNLLLHKFYFKNNLEIKSISFSLIISLFLMVSYNLSFFNALIGILDLSSIRGVLFLVNIVALLTLLTFVVLILFSFPYVFKMFLVFVFVGATLAAYFMDTYGIVIHTLMIQNMLETDASEVQGLFNSNLILHLLFWAIIPSLLLLKIRVVHDTPGKEVWIKLKFVVAAVLLSIGLILSMSTDYASFFRGHKNIRQMANPLNFIYAGSAYLLENNTLIDVKPIENDAAINSVGKNQQKPTLFIVVVGETARADHFGLNGYQRDTTPLLAQQNIINFSNVVSCGTETAVSVPCMFSSLGHDHYSESKAKSQEGVLDVIHHAGIPVFWRDNNSSCKGACNRVSYENIQHLQVPDLCNSRECLDEVLLHNLDDKLTIGNMLIVLHQKGSHGPDYFNRYPKNNEYYSPVCKTNQLQDCSKEEVINAYDNTIRYTDYFLNKTIEWLKSKDTLYNTAMIYLSDHGESLGENHLYLHGMPYSFAPKEQKEVPFFIWMSSQFERDNSIDRKCMVNKQNQEYSQDNLFHTLLGLLNIDTSVYKSELDVTSSCRSIN